MCPPNGFCDLDQSLPLSKGCQSSMQCKQLTRAIPLCRCSISRCCPVNYPSHDAYNGGWHMSGYAFEERNRLSCPTRPHSRLQAQSFYRQDPVAVSGFRRAWDALTSFASTPRTSRVGDCVTPFAPVILPPSPSSCRCRRATIPIMPEILDKFSICNYDRYALGWKLHRKL